MVSWPNFEFFLDQTRLSSDLYDPVCVFALKSTGLE